MIANVNGFGAFSETWVSGAKVHEQAGVDLIEINVSCAHGASMEGAVEDYFDKSFPLCNPGLLVGDQIDLVADITEKVVRAVKIPVGVKLSPETGFPRIVEMAKKIKQAGAKFINCGNNAVVIAPPDIYHGGRPKWAFMDANPFVAGSGSWMRMIVYKQIAAIAKFVPGIDLIATGGLTVPEHTVEAMMLGAKVTETATAVMYGGRGFIRRQEQFLTRFMTEQGYHSVDDFIGLGLKYITPAERMDFKIGKIFAEVDPVRCTGCGLCADQMCLAINIVDKIARVNVDDCLGCGMCKALCPKGAMTLKQKN
jgi:dihydropyrimidine dehydrogenase (NAD+) subunit PreA